MCVALRCPGEALIDKVAPSDNDYGEHVDRHPSLSQARRGVLVEMGENIVMQCLCIVDGLYYAVDYDRVGRRLEHVVEIWVALSRAQNVVHIDLDTGEALELGERL